MLTTNHQSSSLNHQSSSISHQPQIAVKKRLSWKKIIDTFEKKKISIVSIICFHEEKSPSKFEWFGKIIECKTTRRLRPFFVRIPEGYYIELNDTFRLFYATNDTEEKPNTTQTQYLTQINKDIATELCLCTHKEITLENMRISFIDKSSASSPSSSTGTSLLSIHTLAIKKNLGIDFDESDEEIEQPQMVQRIVNGITFEYPASMNIDKGADKFLAAFPSSVEQSSIKKHAMKKTDTFIRGLKGVDINIGCIVPIFSLTDIKLILDIENFLDILHDGIERNITLLHTKLYEEVLNKLNAYKAQLERKMLNYIAEKKDLDESIKLLANTHSKISCVEVASLPIEKAKEISAITRQHLSMLSQFHHKRVALNNATYENLLTNSIIFSNIK